MNLKSKYKKIFFILMLIIVSALVFNSTFAEVTINKSGGVGTSQGTFSDISSKITKILGYIGEMAASGVFATITALINILFVVLFLLLGVFMGIGTGDITHLPVPDTIIFNRFAFFDANFINPANNSLLKGFGNILKNLFESFRTIAIAVFILAAMIAGIRMALSTISSKKAQYKEAAMKWLTGFLILMFINIILEGIFYLNEYLVSKLYSITTETDIPVYVTDAVPVFGKLLTDIKKSVAGALWGGNGTLIEIEGYTGIIVANLAKSIGGDIVASIVGFIILGQTLTIIGSYLKRVFMCTLLGLISPLVIAVDTVNAVMGKQSNIFKSWLKNFTITVFMQSIHAIYMVVILEMISKLYAKSGFSGMNSMQIGIVTIVLTTGLVKLEKLFKSVFGIGDSFAGNLKDGAHGMIKAMGAVRGITEGLNAIGDNRKKGAEASKKKNAYAAELARLKGGGSGGKTEINNYNNNNSTNNVSTGGNQGSSQKSSGDYLQDVINGQTANMTREQKIQKLEEAIAEETAKEKSAKLAQLFGPANLVAGIGLGIGMGDDISESLFKGGYITKGLDWSAEKIGYRAADKDRRSFRDYEQEEGKKYNYTPSEKIVREKTVVEKTIGNKSLYVNPAAVGREWDKQFKELGNVFGDTMKKKIKEIDKNIDNQ